MFVSSRARYYSLPVLRNQRSFGSICQYQTLHAKQYHLTLHENECDSACVSTFVILNVDKLLYPSGQIRGVSLGHVTASFHRSRLRRVDVCLHYRHVRANEKSCFSEMEKMTNVVFQISFGICESSRIKYSYIFSFLFFFSFFFSCKEREISTTLFTSERTWWSASFTAKQSRAR